MSDHSDHGKSSEPKPRKLTPIPPEEKVDRYGRKSVMHEGGLTYIGNKWNDLKGGVLKDRKLKKGEKQIQRGREINELPAHSPDRDKSILEIDKQIENIEHGVEKKGTATLTRIAEQRERIHLDARTGVLSSEEAAHAQNVAGALHQKATTNLGKIRNIINYTRKEFNFGDRLMDKGTGNIQKAIATPDSDKRQIDRADQAVLDRAQAKLDDIAKEKKAAAAAAEKHRAFEERVMTSIYASKSHFFDSLRQICADLTAKVNNNTSLSPEAKRALRFALLEYEKKADKELHHISHEVRYALENNHLTENPQAAPDLSLTRAPRKGDKPIKKKTIKLDNGKKKTVAYTSIDQYFSDIEDTYLRFQKSIVQTALREHVISDDEAAELAKNAKDLIVTYAIPSATSAPITPDQSRIKAKFASIDKKQKKRAEQEAKTLPTDERYKRDLERQQKSLEKRVDKEVASYKNEIKNNTLLQLPKKKSQQEALKKIYSEYTTDTEKATLQHLVQTTYDFYRNRDGVDTRAYWKGTDIAINTNPDTPEMELLIANDIPPDDVYSLSPEKLKQLAVFIDYIYKTKNINTKKQSLPKAENIRTVIESQLPGGQSYAKFLLDYLVPAKSAEVVAIADRAKYYAALPDARDEKAANSEVANKKAIDNMVEKLAESIEAEALKHGFVLNRDPAHKFILDDETEKALRSEVLRYVAVQYGNIPIPRAEYHSGQKPAQADKEKKNIDQRIITGIDALNSSILSKFMAKVDKNSKDRKPQKLKIKTLEDVDKLSDTVLDYIAEHCYFDVSPIGNTAAARLRQRLIERRFLRDIETQKQAVEFYETVDNKIRYDSKEQLEDAVKKLPSHLRQKMMDLITASTNARADVKLLLHQEKETAITTDKVRTLFDKSFETTKALAEFGIQHGLLTTKEPLDTILAEARKHLEERALEVARHIPLAEIVNPNITSNIEIKPGLRGLAPAETGRRSSTEYVDLLELLNYTDLSRGDVVHDILTGTISTSRYDSLTNRDYQPVNSREKDGTPRKDFDTAKSQELRNAKRLLQYPIPSNDDIKERYTDLYRGLRSQLDTLAHDRSVLEGDPTAPDAKEKIARNNEVAAAIEHTLVEFEKFVRNQIYAGFIFGNTEPYAAWKKIPEFTEWTNDITPPTDVALRKNAVENAVESTVDELRDTLRETLARRGLYRGSWKKDALTIGNYLNALEAERGKPLSADEKKQLIAALDSSDVSSLEKRQLEITLGKENYERLMEALAQEEKHLGRPLNLKEIREVTGLLSIDVKAEDIAKIAGKPLEFSTVGDRGAAITALRSELESALDARSRLSPVFARIDTILSNAIPRELLERVDGKTPFTDAEIQASVSGVVNDLREFLKDKSVPDDVRKEITAFTKKIEVSTLPVEQVLDMIHEYRDNLRASHQNEISPDQARGIELILTRERLSGNGLVLLRDLVNRNTITTADITVLTDHVALLKKRAEVPSVALPIITDYAREKPLILDLLRNVIGQNEQAEEIQRLVRQLPPDVDALAPVVQRAIEQLPESDQLPFSDLLGSIRSYLLVGDLEDDVTHARSQEKILNESKKFLDAYEKILLTNTVEAIERIVHRVQAEKVGWEEMRVILHDNYIGSRLAGIVESANATYPAAETGKHGPDKEKITYILGEIRALLLSTSFITPTMRAQIDAIIRSPATIEQNLAAIIEDSNMSKRLEGLLNLGKQGGELEKTMLDLLKEGTINGYITDLYRADSDDSVPWPTDHEKKEDDPWYLDMSAKLAEERPLIDRLRDNRRRIIEFYSSITGNKWPSEDIAKLKLTDTDRDRVNNAGDFISTYFTLTEAGIVSRKSASHLVSDFSTLSGTSLMDRMADYLKNGSAKELQDIGYLLHTARETMDARVYIGQLTGEIESSTSTNREAVLSCQQLLYSYIGDKDALNPETKAFLRECELLAGNTNDSTHDKLIEAITDYVHRDQPEPLQRLLEQARVTVTQRAYLESTGAVDHQLLSDRGDRIVECAKHLAVYLSKEPDPATAKKIIDTANQFLDTSMLLGNLIETYCSTGEPALLKKIDTALLRSQYMIEADVNTKARINAAAESIQTIIHRWILAQGSDFASKIHAGDLMRIITANTVSYAGYADGVMRPGDLDPSKLKANTFKELQKQVRQVNKNLLSKDEQIPANYITKSVDDIAYLNDEDLERINQTIEVFLSPLGSSAENLLQQRLIAQKIITRIRDLAHLDPNSSVTSERIVAATDTEAPAAVPPKKEINDIDPTIRHALGEDEKRIYEFHIRDTNPVYFDSMPPLLIPHEVLAIRTLYTRLEQWKNSEASTPDDKHRADMAISALRLNVRQGVELISDPGQRRDVNEALAANNLSDWISDLPKPTAETYRQAAIANEVTAFREELKEKMNRPEPMIFIPTPDTKIRQEAYKKLRAELEKEKDDASNLARAEALKMLTTFKAEVKESFGQRMRYLTETKMEGQILDKETMMNNILYFWREAGLADWLETTRVIAPDYQPKPLTPRAEAKKTPPPTPERSIEVSIDETPGGVVEKTPSAVARVEKTSNQRVKRIVAEPSLAPVSSARASAEAVSPAAAPEAPATPSPAPEAPSAPPAKTPASPKKPAGWFRRNLRKIALATGISATGGIGYFATRDRSEPQMERTAEPPRPRLPDAGTSTVTAARDAGIETRTNTVERQPMTSADRWSDTTREADRAQKTFENLLSTNQGAFRAFYNVRPNRDKSLERASILTARTEMMNKARSETLRDMPVLSRLENPQTRGNEQNKYFMDIATVRADRASMAKELRSIADRHNIPRDIFLGVLAQELLPDGKLRNITREAFNEEGGYGMRAIDNLMSQLKSAYDQLGSWQLAIMRINTKNNGNEQLKNGDISGILQLRGMPKADAENVAEILRNKKPDNPNNPVRDILTNYGIDAAMIQKYIDTQEKANSIDMRLNPGIALTIDVAGQALRETLERNGIRGL